MKYDVLIIGGGPGGYTAAFEAVNAKMKTCLIEEREVGGTCLNRGCIPTKTLVHTADLYRDLADEAHTAIHAENISVDHAALLNKKNAIVTQLREGIEKALKAGKIDVIKGHAVIENNQTVCVNDELIEAKNIIIAAGSEPARIPVEGYDLPGVITSDDILSELPACESMVIVGGGVIGCEMAGIYEALGTKVTVLEAMDRLLPNLESELGRSLALVFKKRGIDVHAKSLLRSIRKEEDHLVVSYEEKNELKETPCSLVLMAAGRKANTDLFKNEKPAVERGRLVIDEHYMTSMEHVYAIGDCAGGYPQLAHTAMAMAVNVIAFLNDKETARDLNVIPSGVYTSPEIASAGISEAQAKEAGIETVSGKVNTLANARSLIASKERGFIKVVAEKHTGKLIGTFMMCERATDLIQEAALAIEKGMTVSEVLRVIHGHPTFIESFVSALEAAEKKLG